MRTSSAKAKARRLQNFVAGVFLHMGKRWSDFRVGDVYPRQMGGSGVDTVLSPKAFDLFPFAVECKQVEKLNVYQAFFKNFEKYADDRTFPILVHSKNRSRILVTVTFEDFLRLVYGRNEYGKFDVSKCLNIEQVCAKMLEMRDSWEQIEALMRTETEAQPQ